MPKVEDVSRDSFVSRPVVLLGALAALTLIPFLIIMVTSFVKISVVLSVVRSALGTQQIPPSQVITGLAIVLTVYIMAPVGLELYRQSKATITEKQADQAIFSPQSVELIWKVVTDAKEPIARFLMRHSHAKDRSMFYTMARRLRARGADRDDVGPEDLMVIVPAFVISELKEAFQIGFIIFVPFLVIDMVVANILMALGMQMLSPTTISLPFKILLFVMIDGWYLVTKGLISGYL